VKVPSLGLLTDRDFRRYFVSTAVSALGNQFAILALPLVAVLTLNATPFQVGLLSAVSTAGFLLIGLPAGAWIDRMRTQPVIVAADALRAVFILVVPLAALSGLLTIWLLYGVALLGSFCNAFGLVARQSYLPHLAGRANLIESNAKLGGIEQVTRLAGPSVAGQLIAVLTAPLALLVTVASLAVSSVSILLIRRPDPPREKRTRNLWAEVLEGLRFVFANRLMRATVTSISWTNLWGLAYSSMLVLFMAQTLHQSPGVIGGFLSVSAVGGLAGAFAARRLAGRLGQGPVLWVSLVVGMPFLFVLPAIRPGWQIWLAGFGYAVAQCSIVVVNVVNASARQVMAPDHLLGRMNATVRFLTWSTAPIGSLTGGVLGTTIGPRATLAVAAGGATLGFLPIFLSPLRRMATIPTWSPKQIVEDPSPHAGEDLPRSTAARST
jgi:hypothetical protein